MEPHDAPPPPYSETDIYSQPGHSPLQAASPNNNADDASIAASSSHSNIVYTPPDTPRESHHDFAAPEDHKTTASAQVYFDSRAATGDHIRQPLIHQITVSEDPAPFDFPYPNWAPERDTTAQDWQTFINYLIPDYADKTNANIINRKLQAEDDASSRGIAEAQLEQLRSATQRRRFEDTVHEWNSGFFAPRGVTIDLNISASTTSKMPGSWEITFDNNAAPSTSGGRGGWREMLESHFGMDANSRSLKIGPITIDGDRVAIGKSFEADSRGVRWNGRDIADHFPSGPLPPGPGPVARGGDDYTGLNQRGRGSGFGERGGFGGRGFGERGFGGRGFGGRGFGERGHWRGRDKDRGREYLHDHHHHQDEGGHGRGGWRGSKSRSRSRSVSTVSSSSGSSASSVGSLPEWDELKDAQIPVVKTSIQSWLSHPDQPITKSEFRRVKGEIKAAKSLPQPTNVPPGQKDEIKNLLKQWSELKKSQKNIRKLARKEKKAQKKADKKARRNRRRTERRGGSRRRNDLRGVEHDLDMEQKFIIPGPSLVDYRSVADAPGFAGPSTVPGPERHGPDAFFGPGRSGGPGLFGSRGLFGRRSFGNRGSDPAHGHDISEHARSQEQAAQSRAESFRQSGQARAQARQTQAEAFRQASQARAQAYRQASQARAQAFQQASQARAQAFQQATQAQAQAHAQAELSRALAKLQAAQSETAAGSPQFLSQQKAIEALQVAQAQIQGVQALAGKQKATHEHSAAKYEEVEELQEELLAKMDSMQILQEKIQAEGIAAARAGNGDKKVQSQTQLEAEHLETEIEALGQRVETLRIEADEEFAREIEKEEREGGQY